MTSETVGAAYLRIADHLRRRVRNGELRPGQQLPSDAALVATYGVTRNTIARSIDLLRAEGLIVGHKGAGRYVSDPLPEPTEQPKRQDDDIRAQLADHEARIARLEAQQARRRTR